MERHLYGKGRKLPTKNISSKKIFQMKKNKDSFRKMKSETIFQLQIRTTVKNVKTKIIQGGGR